MLTLPSEILYIIFDFLTLEEWKNLSLTHSTLNTLVQSHLFSSVACSWSDLPELLQLHFAHHIHKLITKGMGEWKYSLYLRDLAELCPNFSDLQSQTTSSSSGWLKYISPPPLLVTRLSLESTVPERLNLFDFDHVLGMPYLREVTLRNFQIITPESPHPTIETISLTNCTWQYPDDISDIGDIKRLSIVLNHELHPFAFSERLQFVANNPPTNLEDLQIYLDTGHKVSWKPLHNGSKTLKRLSLRGFQSHRYRSLPEIIELDQN